MKDFNGNEIDDLSWQGCSPLTCQQCGKTYGWLMKEPPFEKIILSFCDACFEDDA